MKNESIFNYEDHVKLWQSELKGWVPEVIFDAHVHLGRMEDVDRGFSPARQRLALSSFSNLTWEELEEFYERLYEGKEVEGLFAFPFPLQEISYLSSNQYIIELMKKDHRIKGFLWADPLDTAATIDMFKKAESQHVRYVGVKPYFDLLGKSNFETRMEEILPLNLLAFMNSERLLLMLHTTGEGISDTAVRDHIKFVVDKFPNITIILAHMGRFIGPKDFSLFMGSDLPDRENLYLDTSSVTEASVFEMILEQEKLRDRLLFASDAPFGLITGVEFFSESAGAIFKTRGRYSWSEPGTFGHDLTYNTYHGMKALKDAMEKLWMGNTIIVLLWENKAKIFSQKLEILIPATIIVDKLRKIKVT